MHTCRRFSISMLFVLFAATMAWGGGIPLHGVALRGGVADSRLDENFEKSEMSIQFAAPWQWQTSGDMQITTLLESNLGLLQGGGERALIVSIGPTFVFTPPGAQFFLYIGTGPGYLTRETFGEEDFGGRLTFVSYAGAGFRPAANWCFGYRFQHMSNADIYDKNPGLNVHLLEVTVLF